LEKEIITRATKIQVLEFIRRKGVIEAGDLVVEFGYSTVHTTLGVWSK